jgi:hypothetical protein
MALPTIDELEEERKEIRDKAWKDDQLDRIEQTVNSTHSTVKNIGYVVFCMLLIIIFQV